MSKVTYRRCFGLIYGALIGLLFTGVSQSINHLAMPGVPLYQPPFGMVVNILAGILVGFLVVGLDAWPETTGRGILYSCLLAALLVDVALLFIEKIEPGRLGMRITATILIFFPIAGAMAPLMFLLRWVINQEENAYWETNQALPVQPATRILLPVGILLAAAGLGYFSLYNNLGRTVTPEMHDLIQLGQAAVSNVTSPNASAQDPNALPEPLRPPNVNSFSEYGRGDYRLQWDKDETNRFAIPRPNTPFSEQSIVIAHFNNGYMLVCMYPGGDGQVECRDFRPGQTTAY